MTPSQFYRKIRPEFFSDSVIETEFLLPKEVLALELEKITTNRKENDFETLARRLAEKRISPNLIPQVGPTGGGDGKTDAETHKVSELITERWYIPQHGWTNDERWAFAISAKAQWKSKLRQDIKGILGTERDYTQVFFITNQKVPSKTKRETEDALKSEFGIAITILDAEWITESVYNNDLIDLAVDCLHLSASFKKNSKRPGKNDTERESRLKELERDLANPNRYSEHDYQLVEDALQAAVLARMLEKPKDDVIGRFDRAMRFAAKTPNHQQSVRLHYQRAWTSLQFYDDFAGFMNDFQSVKQLIDQEKSISSLELYFNLFNLLSTVYHSASLDVSDFTISMTEEEEQLKKHLNDFATHSSKPTSALIGKTHIAILDLFRKLRQTQNTDEELKTLKDCIRHARGHIDYPFEQFQEMIERIGPVFSESALYEELIESLSTEAEIRGSELASGTIFLRRGAQQYLAKRYKESIIYFGKALLKLAKEESQDGFGLALRGLAESYSAIDLVWAANSCYIANCSILLKSFYEKGIVNPRTLDAVRKLLSNELFIGRVPAFLHWHELLKVLSNVHKVSHEEAEEDNIEDDLMYDGCLSVRMLHTKTGPGFEFLPAIFEKNTLTLAETAVLYNLGYSDLLLTAEYGVPAKSTDELDAYLMKWASQPFVHQIRYTTNLLYGDRIVFSSVILGCTFNIDFNQDNELYWAAEALLAFFEGLLGTSLEGVIPSTETISIHLYRNVNELLLKVTALNESATDIAIELNSFSFDGDKRQQAWGELIMLFGQVVGKNFFFKDAKLHLENLFTKEEVNDRLGLLLDHRKFSVTVLGSSPKYFLQQWKGNDPKVYSNIRTTPLAYKIEKEIEKPDRDSFREENIGHAQRKVSSIINNQLWDHAVWQAFGAAYQRNDQFAIILGFKNIEAGKKIFSEWIDRFGNRDKEEKIRICIVRGVDRNNPHFYRVLVTTKLNKDEFKGGKFIYSTIRFHEMTPASSNNLDNILEKYNRLKCYTLFPAMVKNNGAVIDPVFDLGILKGELEVKQAYEIGLHDMDRAVIRKDDDPVLPEGSISFPVLELLAELRKQRL